ncbi:hypothetical protein D3C87_1929560 [compost metagenome]
MFSVQKEQACDHQHAHCHGHIQPGRRRAVSSKRRPGTDETEETEEAFLHLLGIREIQVLGNGRKIDEVNDRDEDGRRYGHKELFPVASQQE